LPCGIAFAASPLRACADFSCAAPLRRPFPLSSLRKRRAISQAQVCMLWPPSSAECGVLILLNACDAVQTSAPPPDFTRLFIGVAENLAPFGIFFQGRCGAQYCAGEISLPCTDFLQA